MGKASVSADGLETSACMPGSEVMNENGVDALTLALRMLNANCMKLPGCYTFMHGQE
jgi:hypothetical protein